MSERRTDRRNTRRRAGGPAWDRGFAVAEQHVWDAGDERQLDHGKDPQRVPPTVGVDEKRGQRDECCAAAAEQVMTMTLCGMEPEHSPTTANAASLERLARRCDPTLIA